MKKFFQRVRRFLGVICILAALTGLISRANSLPVKAESSPRDQLTEQAKDSGILDKLDDLMKWGGDRIVDIQGVANSIINSTSRHGYRQNNRPSTPVLNAVINGKWGDERSFVRVIDLDDDKPHGHSVRLKKGHTYKVVVYYINDCKYSKAAKDVSVYLDLPRQIQANNSDKLTALLASGNTDPELIFDSVTLKAQENLKLKYTKGSLKIYNQGQTNGKKLNAANAFNLNKRATLGYNQLDGEIPAGKQYSGKVTLKFRAE